MSAECSNILMASLEADFDIPDLKTIKPVWSCETAYQLSFVHQQLTDTLSLFLVHVVTDQEIVDAYKYYCGVEFLRKWLEIYRSSHSLLKSELDLPSDLREDPLLSLKLECIAQQMIDSSTWNIVRCKTYVDPGLSWKQDDYLVYLDLSRLQLRSEEHHIQSPLLRQEDGDRPTYKYEDKLVPK